MERIIAGFRKADHFLYRQWDRSVDDRLLIELMRALPAKHDAKAKYNLIFGYQYCQKLRQQGFDVPKLRKGECLVLALKNFVLITIYKYNSLNQLGLLVAHRGEVFIFR